MTKAKGKQPKALVATTGLNYLGKDGKDHRLEAGESVDPADVNPDAVGWMTEGGFLVPAESED
jgi:hypothetical protein